MAEPLMGAAVNLAKGPVGDLYIGAKHWFARLDPGGRKLADYRDGLWRSLNQIQIMGMSQPRELKNIYIALRALPEQKKNLPFNADSLMRIDQERIATTMQKLTQARHQTQIDSIIDELGYGDIIRDERTRHEVSSQKASSEANDSVNQSTAEAFDETLHGVNAIGFVTRSDRLMILGHPGSGKTTFLKYLALAYHEQNEHNKLFHLAMEDPHYREVFLMIIERVYSPDKLALGLACHAKGMYIDKKHYSPYIAGLVADVLRADIAMNAKVRALLHEISTELQILALEPEHFSDAKEEDSSEHDDARWYLPDDTSGSHPHDSGEF